MVFASITEALVTALIAVGSTLGAVFLTYWLPEGARRRGRLEQQRGQAAEVIEPVRNLLLDAKGVKTEEDAERIRQAWLTTLRDPLTIFGMAQGSADVSAAVLRLREGVGHIVSLLQTSDPERKEALDRSIEAATAIIRDLRSAYGMDVHSGGIPVRDPDAQPLSVYRAPD